MIEDDKEIQLEKETQLENEIVEWITLTAKKLVEFPDQIEINTAKKTEGKARTLIVMIDCNNKDNGKLIGKKGAVIQAMRRLVMSMLGKVNKRINILVMD
jgi:predicted RNA-binding protein YlqC (UPF0109 family)